MLTLAVTWTEAGPGIAGIISGCLLLSVLIWQIGRTLQARAAGARENAYRQLAEDALNTEQRLAGALERTAEELTTIRTRIDEIERILKEVD